MNHMRTFLYTKFFAIAAALAAFALSFAPAPPAVAAAEPPAAVGRLSSELAVYLKSAASAYDGLASSPFMEDFGASKLGARYEETMAAGKMAQLKRAIAESFGSSVSYAKALAFFDCPASLFVITSDLEALSLVFAVERDISKFEYFVKLKKGVRSEKCGASTMYALASAEGVDSVYFGSRGARTFFANDAALARSIITGATAVEEPLKSAAPITVYINLNKLDAKVGAVYKKSGGQSVFIFPSAKGAGGEIRAAAFNGEKLPDSAVVEKALAALDKIDVPADVTFAASVFGLPSSDFFAASLRYAEKFALPRELCDALKTLASSKGAGVSIAAGGGPALAPGAETGILAGLSARIAFGVEACPETAVATLAKYLPGASVEYKDSLLSVANAPGAAAGETSWARNFNSAGRASAGYFYFLRYDGRASAAAENIMNATLAINSWQGSNAYDFMSDLKESAGLLKKLDTVLGLRPSGIEGLNSVIRITLN